MIIVFNLESLPGVAMPTKETKIITRNFINKAPFHTNIVYPKKISITKIVKKVKECKLPKRVSKEIPKTQIDSKESMISTQ